MHAYAQPMVSRTKDTHTTNRVMRIDDEDWEDLGAVVGDRHRSETVKAFIRWYLRRPGAKLPERPTVERIAEVQAAHTDLRQELAAVSTAEGMLHLLAAEPTLLPEAPLNATAQQIDHRRLNETHPCLRCGQPAHLAYVAATKLGPRWLDLCMKCGRWLRTGLHQQP